MILWLLLVPVASGMLAFAPTFTPLRRILLVTAATIHAGLVLATWVRPVAPRWSGMLALDAAGHLFLTITSLLFLAVAFYVAGYLGREVTGQREDFTEQFL